MARRRMLAMDGEPVEGSKRRVWTDVNRSVSYAGAVARVGRAAMEENSAWKAARVGTVEAAHWHGSARMWARRGSTERAGRESMREATKEAGARAVASGREMPPAVAGRRSWKAVRLGPSERSIEGSRRRMARRWHVQREHWRRW